MENQEQQERESERVICQRACSGRLVSFCDTVFRRFSFGRYWCLYGLAKRGGGGNPRVALKSGTGFPHDKKHFPNSKSRLPRVSRHCGSDTWHSWAPLRSRSNAERRKVGHVEADTALVVVEFLKLHCHSDAWKTAMTSWTFHR